MKNKTILLIAIITALAITLVSCSVIETQQAGPTAPAATGTPAENEAVDPDNPAPLAADMKTRNPEDIFRFETTALHDPYAKTINPTGMLLNIGCEDCQDIFYASRSLTVEEVKVKIMEDFGITEMVSDENFVRFDLHIDLVRQLEIELDLIAAKKLSVPDEYVNIRIISIKP
ncbi:MAG: hypothetical protein JXB33_09515 [Clostridia bacterium]|nr:hypothetical protein [Clostridia bacterium]